MSAQKIEIHLNGINREEIHENERQARAREFRKKWGLLELGIPDDALLIGFAARIAREKRLDRVLHVIKHLKEMSTPALPDWRLLVFGVGPLELKLKALTKRLDLQDRVHWMGYRHGLGAEMAGFDLLISLSDAEGLPINLLEAGWSATPVFATAVDGNLDLFSLPGLVTMVPLHESEHSMAQKLLPFIEDQELRRRAGRKFQERVKSTFCGDNWLAQLKRIYGELRAS